jgi:hypothetical protein
MTLQKPTPDEQIGCEEESLCLYSQKTLFSSNQQFHSQIRAKEFSEVSL